MMKKYNKRLFSSLMVPLLLGGNLVSSIGAYAETVPAEPKTGETTGGESPIPPNGETKTSLPSLQDNLPKPTDPSVPEQSKFDTPDKELKPEEPEKELSTINDEKLEVPALGNLIEAPSVNGPDLPSNEPYLDEGYIGTSHWYVVEEATGKVLHIGAGDLGDSTQGHAIWTPNLSWANILSKPNVTNIDITFISIDGKVTLSSNAFQLFGNFSNVTKIENIQNLDTSKVTDMVAMFRDMSSLTELDVSNFNTSNVTDMASMFSGMSSLTELNVSSFDTANVTDMNYMFTNLSSLTKLDVSNFNTSKVTLMPSMFSGMSSLIELDVSSFDTANVINMSGMFYGLSSLTRLDVTNFNTSKVTNMAGMFSGLSSLTGLDVSSFNTSKVRSMYVMFSDMSSLTKLDISNFNTANVTDMPDMFSDMSSLTSITLGSTIRLSTEMNWADVDGQKWKNINKPDLPLLSPSEIIAAYNDNVDKYSGTYNLVKTNESNLSVHDSTIYVETPSDETRLKSSNWNPIDNFDYALDSSLDSIDFNSVKVSGGDFDRSILGPHEVVYTFTDKSGQTSEATAIVTVKQTKDVTIHAAYKLVHVDGTEEPLTKATLTTNWQQPIDFMKQLDGFWNYTLKKVSLKTDGTHSDEYNPKVNYVDEEKVLYYLPGWEEEQEITILVSENKKAINIVPNTLTFNLGQSNPGDLSAGIKSITATQPSQSIDLEIIDANNVSSTTSAKYEIPETTLDLKADPHVKLDVTTDLVAFATLVSTAGTNKSLNLKVGIHSSKLNEPEMIVGEQTVAIPVTVQLGNALALRSYGNRYEMYLPLDGVSNPNTFSVKAIHADSGNNIIHPSVPGIYYSVGFLSRAEGVSLNTAPDWNININGASVRSLDAVNAINAVDHTFDKNNTNIIKVHHTDAIIWRDTFGLITNGAYTRITRSTGPGLRSSDFFFEMTDSGYKLLTLNQLTTKAGPAIFVGASNDYLDSRVTEFIAIDNYPGLTVQWSERPDTTTAGPKPAKLVVTQKSSTGKDLTYEYPVTVNVDAASPDYAVQLPSGIQFTQANEPANGSNLGSALNCQVKLVNLDDRQAYSREDNIKIAVTSTNGWQLKDNQNVIGATYQLTGAEGMTMDTIDSAFLLNKEKTEQTLTANLTTKAAKSGNYSDTLTFSYNKEVTVE